MASALLFALVFAIPVPGGAWGISLAGPLLACLLVWWAPSRRPWPVAVPVAAGLWLLLVFKLADNAVYAAYGRALNPFVDAHLPAAGARLAAGTLGLPPALVAAILLVLLLAAFGLLVVAARTLAAHLPSPPWRHRAAPLLAAGAATLLVFWPGDIAYLVQRAGALAAFQADRAAFNRAASAQDTAPGAGHGVMQGLEGRDVILVFLESYGRASFDNPLYGPAHDAVRRRAAGLLGVDGVSALSGWLTSPIAGGQSWLAHATLSSGLRIEDQGRYESFLASRRATLFQLAAQAGYDTAAYMPAITMPWPDSRRLGFGHLFAQNALGYRGQAFNWVTMPDQFTLQAFERLSAGLPCPCFSQIVLISSHAPFTPVPPVLPAAQVGDGSVYDRWANSGDPPDVVWRDRDRVRAQYRDAMAYALDVALDFAVRQARQGRLVILVGDHAPAGFISQIPSLDVPVHVIGPDAALAHLTPWAWSTGLTPGTDLPPWPMQDFRDNFLKAFGRAAGAT